MMEMRIKNRFTERETNIAQKKQTERATAMQTMTDSDIKT